MTLSLVLFFPLLSAGVDTRIPDTFLHFSFDLDP